MPGSLYKWNAAPKLRGITKQHAMLSRRIGANTVAESNDSIL